MISNAIFESEMRPSRFLRILIFGQDHARPPRQPYNEIQAQWRNVLIIWYNKTYRDFGLERITRLLLATLQFAFPGLYWKHYFSRHGYLAKKISVEAYVLLKLLIPLVFIYYRVFEYGAWVPLFAAYMTLETLVYLSSLIYFTHDHAVPASYRRSLTTLFINYFQIAMDYALIYGYCNIHYPHFFNQDNLSRLDLLYFSIVTSATVGYGDIVPLSPLAQALVISQIVMFFLFAALFFNFFGSRLRDSQKEHTH